MNWVNKNIYFAVGSEGRQMSNNSGLLISEYSLSYYEGPESVDGVHESDDDAHRSHRQSGVHVPAREHVMLC